MKQFHNILFVSSGFRDECGALQQAIQLAYDNQAALKILIICPPLPRSLEQYKTSYEIFLKENINKTIEAAKEKLPLQKRKLTMKTELEWESSVSICIIQHVLRQSHDLVIKAAEDTNSAGFKALDMTLLRKCPCPLFLHRPFKHSQDIRIAVAIDPNDEDSSEQALTMNLLQLTQKLARNYNGQFSIISCWDFVLEHFLRTSAWREMPQDEIEETIQNEGQAKYLTLSELIKQAGIHNQPTIYHLKGEPSEIIPTIIHDKEIDILVMGTIARTGISGFIIGNTAEDILQKVDCSLWAIKPQGFISPVKAY